MQQTLSVETVPNGATKPQKTATKRRFHSLS